MRVMMVVARGLSYQVNEWISHRQYANVDKMDFEHPLTRLVWLTSFVSIAATYAASYVLIRGLGDRSLWWKLSTVSTCGTLAGAIIPELLKIFTTMNSKHLAAVVTCSSDGTASLHI